MPQRQSSFIGSNKGHAERKNRHITFNIAYDESKDIESASSFSGNKDESDVSASQRKSGGGGGLK
jgi:hypothetical protein